MVHSMTKELLYLHSPCGCHCSNQYRLALKILQQDFEDWAGGLYFTNRDRVDPGTIGPSPVFRNKAKSF
jgi:hypothetical protein